MDDETPRAALMIDGQLVTVPVTDEVQKVIEEFLRAHWPELKQQLEPFGIDHIMLSAFLRPVYMADLVEAEVAGFYDHG